MRILISLLVSFHALAAGAAEYTAQTYNSVGGRDLQMHVVSPDGHSQMARAPAVVFFHGGGWRRGSPESGFPYAEALAEHGVVTLAAEYRFTENATLDEIITDAASAVRWTRERARRLGINPGRIIALGHSAGGHLAASTALLTAFEEADAYTRASPRPNALALLAPYAATSDTAGEYLPPGADIADYEPRENIGRRVPPTLIIQGTADTVVPPGDSAAFHEALVAAGVDSTLHLLEDVGHGFQEEGAKSAISERLVEFMRDLGYVD